MPVLRSGEPFPDWSEIEFFEFITPRPGPSRKFPRRSTREVLFCGDGPCRLRLPGEVLELAANTTLELPEGTGTWTLEDTGPDTRLVRLGGHWQEPCGTRGLFILEPAAHPGNSGTPAEYARNTAFDNHYHDCDEVWIFTRGSGMAVSAGRHHRVTAGDCVLTRRGDHHDFPWVDTTVHAAWFETTLHGRRRPGHLWRK